MSEPRTTADIMADLLEFAERHEWSDLIHIGGDYHEKGCRDCGATEGLCGEHAPDCNRWRLLEEARAFIRVERSTAAPAHTDGDACPSCTEVLGSPSVCAISHDFRPGAYDGAGADAATKPGASCPDCHEDCIGWVVDGNQCGGAP